MNGFTLYGTKLSIVLSNGDLKTQKHRVLYRRPIDDYPVEEEDGLYPIHVSNFPPATLKVLFPCHIKVLDVFCMICH